LLEYMASGLPVIGSRVSGTEDFVVAGKTGWLFPAGDVTQFTACLESASNLGGGQLATLGQNARTMVTHDASIAAVVGRLVDIYSTSPLV
jgi:glycosyltransferase involved in cell wall biosynthesis